MVEMKENKNFIAYLALAAVCIVWGTTYLVLRIGVTQFPPFLFSMIRFLAAGPILIFFMLTIGKATWPDRKVLFNQAVCGLLMVTFGISMVGWAEVYISSGVAAIVCSMMPIWTILINVLISKDERPNWLIVLGLAMGLAGIIMIFGEHLAEFSNQNYLKGIVLTFAANLCWALGSIWIKKKNQSSNPFLNAGIQMFFGGLFLIPFSLALDDYSKIQWNNQVIFSLLYMIMIGSVAAYACYSYAIKKLPMTLVSLYAYINPIVAVILGWLILNEKLNVQIGLAIIVTVTGIYLVNRGYQLKTNQASIQNSVSKIGRTLNLKSKFSNLKS
jgi:drug/metabolite transporter (DMT)-like permease